MFDSNRRRTLFALGVGFSLAMTASGHEIPRLADGKPDLNGVWQVLNTANYNLLAHPARAGLAMRAGPHGPVPAAEVLALGAVSAVPAGLGVVEGETIPYTPEARATQQDNAAHWLERDPEIKCYLPGVPRATYQPFPWQVVQSESAIVIAYEFAGAVRNFFLQDPGEPPVDSWMGQSHAHWEGDTMVVETRGLNGQAWLDRAGNHHSNALQVVERFTLQSPAVMHYEATLTDPNVYTRPWTMSMPVYKRTGRDAQLLQFKCVPFVEELLYGNLRKAPLSGEAPETGLDQ